MKETKASTREDYASRILRVLVYIQEHLEEAPALERLAALAHFSPFHFHRVFRGMVGESVGAHVRRLRLERAAVRLKTSSDPVTEIAFEAGYESHEAFTRAFGSHFGRSPSAFRSAERASPELPAPSRVHFSPGRPGAGFHPLAAEAFPMEAKLRRLEPMRVAFLRHVGPYDEVGSTWERLTDWAGAQCLFGSDTRFFGAAFDDPEITEARRLRYDACMTVDASVRAEGDIGVRTLPGGRYVVALHEGPYSTLGETYAALFGRWFAAQPFDPEPGPTLEFYLNDPDSTDPEDLLTEVCVRIQE